MQVRQKIILSVKNSDKSEYNKISMTGMNLKNENRQMIVKEFQNFSFIFVIVVGSAFCYAGRADKSDVTAGAVVRTIIVADFGAVSGDGQDDTVAVKNALSAAKRAGGSVVVQFENGRYDFFKKSADKANYPVTAVHLQWDFATPLHLDGFKNLTIDGGGATFMMHGRMTPFVLSACRGVTVRGMTIEHERPSVFELKVISKKDGVVEYLAAEGDRFVVEKNRLIWFDADDKRQVPNLTQEYDPLRDTTWRRSNPLAGAKTITAIGKRQIRVKYDPASGIYKNITAGCSFQFRRTIRKQCGAVIFECSDVTFEDMSIHSWNGLGFVGQFSSNVTLRKLRMEPRQGSGRTNAGFSDGIQMMNCRGRLVVEECRIVGLHDDHINIYGQMMKLESVESPQVIRAVYTSGETEGHFNFRPGDRVGFRNCKTLADEGQGRVVKAELLDNKTMRLEINGKIPDRAVWVENRTWIPDEVIIRNNYFGRVATRSILIYLARRAVIENNFFHRIRMASILLQTPDHRYALQNSVGDLTVRNNVFYECAETLIRSNPQVRNLAANSNLYGTIKVKDNFVSMLQARPFFLNLRGFKGVLVERNHIEMVQAADKFVRITDCQSVKLNPQRLTGVAGEPQAELLRVGKYDSESWNVKKEF